MSKIDNLVAACIALQGETGTEEDFDFADAVCKFCGAKIPNEQLEVRTSEPCLCRHSFGFVGVKRWIPDSEEAPGAA